MRLSLQQYDELLLALHQNAFGPVPWQPFLDQLRQFSSARYVSLIFRPLDRDEEIEHFSGPRPDADITSVYLQKYARDPMPHRRMVEGRVYGFDDLIQPDDSVQRSFFTDILQPSGLDNLCGLRVKEPTGAEAWLSIVGPREFDQAITQLLEYLKPHLRTALRNYVALERERFRAQLSAHAMHRMNFGWLTLDARCHVVEWDHHAEQLLSLPGPLRRGSNNRLIAASTTVQHEIARLVAEFADAPEQVRPHAIRVGRDPWMEMLITPIRTQTVPTSPTPVAIVYLSGDRRSSADRCEQLVDLFGLLPSEARLAWSLAQGLSLSEAADALGITRETARSYSKRIYGKLGARGQADVVRSILTSVLAIA